MAGEKYIEVGGRLHSIATGNVLAGANEIIDDEKEGKKQSDINTETDAALEDRYTKDQTYSKSELNNMITTPNQKYVSVTATAQTTAVTDVLSAPGEADTVYRVGNWDGSQYDPSVYSEYAWNGSQYVHLSTKTQIGEVFDISAYHATGGTLATYADLSAALDSNNGGGVPQSLQKGGMSVKFVQSSDNKYVQYRLMADTFNTTVTNWQGVDDEPTAGSDNLVKSGGVFYSNIVPQMSKDYVNIIKNKGYNNQREVVDYDGFYLIDITLKGNEKTVTAFNRLMLQYTAAPLFVFFDENDVVISYYDAPTATVGQFVTQYIPFGTKKVRVLTFETDIESNIITFGYRYAKDDNYFAYVQPLSVIANSDGTISVNGMSVIIQNCKYSGNRLSFIIDGSLSTYLLSSTENSYTRFYSKISEGYEETDLYLIKVPLWNIRQLTGTGEVDSRDIIYNEGVKGGPLWPYIKDALDARQDERRWQCSIIKNNTNNQINPDTIFKKDFIIGTNLSNVSYDIGHALLPDGTLLDQNGFFITYIKLKGNEKNITALNLITFEEYTEDIPDSRVYSITPLFVFYDQNENVIDIYSGTDTNKGKYLTADIPSDCVKIGVNCGKWNSNLNRITLGLYNSKVLNILGDSITEQNYYTSALAKMGYVINNYGISGTTITTTVSNNFKSRVTGMTDTCDAVIVFGGINDWQLGAPLGEKFETTDESKFYPALNELFVTLKNKYVNKPIYVCTPLHSQFHLEGYEDKMEYTENNNLLVANKYGNGDILSKYVQAIKDMAQLYSIQVIDLYSESGMAALIPSNKSAYYNDGLHPNAAGGVLIAKCIDKYLK